jgi:hypothetical protein
MLKTFEWKPANTREAEAFESALAKLSMTSQAALAEAVIQWLRGRGGQHSVLLSNTSTPDAEVDRLVRLAQDLD